MKLFKNSVTYFFDSRCRKKADELGNMPNSHVIDEGSLEIIQYDRHNEPKLISQHTYMHFSCLKEIKMLFCYSVGYKYSY